MANSILIMGDSGTGKSTSLRNLDPNETFIINVISKPLPFKNFAKNYAYVSKDGRTGNYFSSDKAADIIKVITQINQTRKDIKNIIIDDFQYIMANQFMRKAKEKGFEKFTEIGQQAWSILNACAEARSDLYCFILSHTELDSSGRFKCKTVGKMLDEKITLEGMFTVVFHAMVVDKKYKFLTQHDGIHVAKSPMGMFDEALIDNDILSIKAKMAEYFGDDENTVKIPDYFAQYKNRIEKSTTEEGLNTIYHEARIENPSILQDVIAACKKRKEVLVNQSQSTQPEENQNVNI